MSWVNSVGRAIGKSIIATGKVLEKVEEPFNEMERKCFHGKLAEEALEEAVVEFKKGYKEEKKDDSSTQTDREGDSPEGQSGETERQGGDRDSGWVAVH